MSESLLRCRGIDVSYGSVQVLFGVDLDVADGELVALLGTNGAGKSTVLKAVCGLIRPDAGRVTFAGSDITGTSPEAAARAGVALMPGGRGIFPTLTVTENLRMAAWSFRREKRRAAEAVTEALERFPSLDRRRDVPAGNLSGGEQQMLSLGQSFMARPRLLLIDELSLGLSPTIVGELLSVVRGIHAAGTTIVVVEQSVNIALELAERAVFMEKGEVRFSGPSAELLERPDVLRAVFIPGDSGGSGHAGRSMPHTPAEPHTATPEAGSRLRDPILECRQVTKRYGGVTAVDHVDLQLQPGEILGLIGQNGAGKTTLFDCLSGFSPIDAGTILLDGDDITSWPAHERAHAGLGRSFQEARLFPSLTVAETLAIACERHLGNVSVLGTLTAAPAVVEAELAVADRADELIAFCGLEAFRQKPVGALSTGSRRIVELACILAAEPRVVLLDEPSAGVAQREVEALGPLLLRVKDATGCSIVLIEHDMPLVRSISDRLIALELGGVIAEGPPDDVLAHPRVIASYLGTDETAISRSSGAGGGAAGSGAAGAGRPRRRRPVRAPR